jgi:predicted HicB family RNase H-like nuclease
MKKAFAVLVFAATICAASAWTQSSDSSIRLTRSAVQAERQALIATNLGLTEEQRAVFWPLYAEYRKAIDEIADDKVEFFERFFASYETLTDGEALALLDESFKLKARYLEVQKTHAAEMRKHLSGKTVARFFQIENKMDVIVDYEMSGEFPLIK